MVSLGVGIGLMIWWWEADGKIVTVMVMGKRLGGKVWEDSDDGDGENSDDGTTIGRKRMVDSDEGEKKGG